MFKTRTVTSDGLNTIFENNHTVPQCKFTLEKVM